MASVIGPAGGKAEAMLAEQLESTPACGTNDQIELHAGRLKKAEGCIGGDRMSARVIDSVRVWSAIDAARLAILETSSVLITQAIATDAG